MSGGKINPRMLALGDCKECGEQVVVAKQKGVPDEAYADEEFCSSVCCRRYYGIVMPSDPKPKPADA